MTSAHTTTTLLVLLCIGGALGINCPATCKCFWEVDSLVVDCSNRGFTEYPLIEEGLPVERLDLSNNYFQEFPSHYAFIHSLIYLDLSNNDIQEIQDEALIGFESLRVLNLANNTIENWRDLNPNVAFQHAFSLQKLSLAGNRLARFSDADGGPLLVSDLLIELDLSRCGITQINNVLGGLPSLEKLVLSGNNIKALTSLPSKSLRVLDVSNCSLTWVSPSLPNTLPSLTVLDVSSNSGVMLAGKAGELMRWNTLLQIDVSFCHLDAIDVSGMPNLIVLLARGNMLRSITDTLLANNTALEKVDLSRNDIRQLEPSAFSNLRRLSELDLSYNEIIRFDRNQFRNNDVLVTINLSRNIFSEFSRFISNSLRTLDLSWCEILNVDYTALSGFKTLVSLDLSHNLFTELPGGMRSETLKKLDLSNCRLSIIRNSTFQGFPELASLRLSGNRITNTFPPQFFRANVFLNSIWLSDNPWRCDCHDTTFMDFYDYLTMKPQKLKDKNNLRCASPPAYYGRTWDGACMSTWAPTKKDEKAKQVWTTMMIILLGIGCLLMVYTCVKKFLRRKIKQRNRRERQENEEELAEIRRRNRLFLDNEAQMNAPTALETMLPSYEDALRMPKLHRASKSMMDLSNTRKPRTRTRTEADFEEECVLDTSHRFRSEEMLSNRDKERTAPVSAFRRIGRIEHNHSGSRRFSIEDNRFPAAHLKAQNLQSAERIGNFQSYENSPYAKRRPKAPTPPVFKRANVNDSVEFLTDSEYNSKPGSPFAVRRPGADIAASSVSLRSERAARGKAPFNIVEEHFGRDEADAKSKSVDSSLSDFQVMRTSDANLASSTDSTNSPVVVVHTPIRESKF